MSLTYPAWPREEGRMGFGFDIDVKIEVPKVDVTIATSAVSGAVSGAVDSAKSAVDGAIGAATGAVSGTAEAATGEVAALSSVAGAIVDVGVSFKGPITDRPVEPHIILTANSDYEETKFKNGPLWIRVDLTKEEADASTDTLHLVSDSGNYNEEIEVCKYKQANDFSVDILFKDVPMNELYTLTVNSDGGATVPIFQNIAYSDLHDNKWTF